MITIKRMVAQELRLIVGLSPLTAQAYATVEDLKIAFDSLPHEEKLQLVNFELNDLTNRVLKAETTLTHIATFLPDVDTVPEDELWKCAKAQLDALLLAEKRVRVAEASAEDHKKAFEALKKANASVAMGFQQRVDKEREEIVEARKAAREAGSDPDGVVMGMPISASPPVPGGRGVTPLKATSDDNPPEAIPPAIDQPPSHPVQVWPASKVLEALADHPEAALVVKLFMERGDEEAE